MDDKTGAERSPHNVDLHVGARIRTRRKALGVSQERLADQLGLTFQQVQKYERGANRVSASKLYEIGRALGAVPAWFYEGLVEASVPMGVAEGEAAPFVHDLTVTPEAMELAAVFSRIKRSKVRRRMMELARALADEDAASEA